MKRLFIGIPVNSENVRVKTLSWQEDPTLNLNRLAWVRPSNWHFTLVFLGAIHETDIATLCTIIDQAFHACPSYTAALKGVGAFPGKRRPNVLWIGLDDIGPLLSSYQNLVDLLTIHQFSFDPKPLKPHLTIARVKSLYHRDSFDQLLDTHQFTSFGLMPIKYIILYESVTSPNGVIYKPLYERKLIEGGG